MSITSLPSGDFSRCWRSERARSAARQHLGVGADQDAGDRALHLERTRVREQARDLLQALRVGQALLASVSRARTCAPAARHACDARGDGAQLAHVGQRPVAQVDLRDRDIVVVADSSARARCVRGPRRCPGRPARPNAPRCRAARRRVPAAAAPRSGSRPGGSSRRDRPRSGPGCRAPCDRRSCARTRPAPAPATASPGCAPAPSCASARDASSASRANSR